MTFQGILPESEKKILSTSKDSERKIKKYTDNMAAESVITSRNNNNNNTLKNYSNT